MTPVTINASRVRVPEDARHAIENRRDVQVVAHDRLRFVIINAEDYAFVAPLLERHRQGRPVPIDELLDDDDYAIIADLDAEDGDLATGIAEAWTDLEADG